jgi:MFS family permease
MWHIILTVESAFGSGDGNVRIWAKQNCRTGLLFKHVRHSSYSGFTKEWTDSARYQFGQAFGGVLFPPYSEAFGRKPVYISASLIYCIACVISGTTPSIAGAITGRFVAGFVSAVPSIVVSGSIEDMFNMTQRIWIMYVWASATTAGLLLGPIYGSYISRCIGWCVPYKC